MDKEVKEALINKLKEPVVFGQEIQVVVQKEHKAGANINSQYSSCKKAKELEVRFQDAVGKVIEVDNEWPHLDISNMDNVYNMLQKGNEYISYLMAAGAYKPKRRVHDGYSDAPTTIISRAIEQVEQMGNYKVMFALVDLDKSKPKKECLYTFTDIESKALREVIYKEMEKEM